MVTEQTLSPPQQTSNARLIALSALVFTLDKKKPLDAHWPQDRYFQSAAPSDRAFAQLLAKTTLRRLGQIDDLLQNFLEQPIDKQNSRIMHALRLGVTQLIWLETPPHAAVHSAVEMTKQLKLEKYSGLVNAVLKRVAKEGRTIIDAQDAPKLNTPEWLWKKWEKAYGEKLARAIVEQHLKEPPLDLTVKSNPANWATELKGKVMPTGSVRLTDAKNITHLKGFAEGEWWVQDMAATIPAKLLGNVNHKRVIDLCAAPGGKTAQLAAAGARVSAVDVSKDRIAILKTNVHRLQLTADYFTIDATKWAPAEAPDAILLDAPCSATGTLRRHPDVAWNKKPEDIERLCASQKKLLHHAFEMLKPGGTMVYAVCSLQPEEAEQQITAFLKEHANASLVPVDAALIGDMKECITKKGELRTLPCHLGDQGGMDGFYAAVIKKNP
jgi:16S rRNA (cytosine967-C5)-methyltransferase